MGLFTIPLYSTAPLGAEVGLRTLAAVGGVALCGLAAVRERVKKTGALACRCLLSTVRPVWGNDRIERVRKRMDEMEL